MRLGLGGMNEVGELDSTLHKEHWNIDTAGMCKARTNVGFKTLGRLREEGNLEKFPQIHARYSNDTETCSRVHRNHIELVMNSAY